MDILKHRFKDKVMIITGAARGIGESVATRAYKEGAKVVLVDLLEKEGQALRDKIVNDGGEAIYIKADLSKEKEVQSLVNKTIDYFGSIDILINNAGVTGIPTKLHLLSKEDFDFVFKINFYSVFFCCKYVLREFIKQNNGGIIVNTSSIAGIIGQPGTPAYVTSKHAINGLTKNIAIDYAKYGIRINSVNPAPTKTPMEEEARKIVKTRIETAIKNGDIKPNEVNSLFDGKSENLQKRAAEAYEQAASILFLASDESSHMTGTIMQTDGGWTAF